MEKRLRFKFAKTGVLKYLSHLDIINIIIVVITEVDFAGGEEIGLKSK